MKREIYIYLIYFLIVFTITAYLSIKVIRGESYYLSIRTRQLFTGLFHEKYKFNLSDWLKDDWSGEKMEIPKCPCEKIGFGSPGCLRKNIRRDSENPFLETELVPGSESIFDGSVICLPATTQKINSHGFRDHEYSIKKPDNTLRIIVLGDSNVFGDGVELNETFPKILERLLNSKTSEKNYEVLNLGVPSYNILEKVEFFKERGVQFNPDLIILQFSHDDILRKEKLRKIEEKLLENYLIENSLTRHELNQRILAKINYEAHRIYLHEAGKLSFDEIWKMVEEPLEDFAKVAHKKNMKILVLIFYGGDLSAFVKNFSEKRGWYFINLDKTFKKYEHAKLELHSEDRHPNPFAHELMAKEIYDYLIQNKLI